MKRFLSLLLIAVMCISFTGCGKKICSVDGCSNEATADTTFEELLCSKHLVSKKAFIASKVAYDNIDTAYDIIEQIGEDIYEAWRLGIYERDAILDDGAAYLATELSLSEDEIREGIAYYIALLLDLNWDKMSDDEKEGHIDLSDYYLSLMEDEMYSFCVMCVIQSYTINGKIEEAKIALDAAKTQMKELSQEFSDYEHYPNLKGYYTTASSFFDFCNNPSGSFEQIKDTINDYRNEARDYISDLDYIFEE